MDNWSLKERELKARKHYERFFEKMFSELEKIIGKERVRLGCKNVIDASKSWAQKKYGTVKKSCSDSLKEYLKEVCLKEYLSLIQKKKSK